MIIVEQRHEILFMDSPERIERAGRTCYKSEDKIGCTIPHDEYSPDHCEDAPEFDSMFGSQVDCSSNCKHHSAYKFCKKLIKSGHEAMIEHASATVHFLTDRGVTHELVRHRLCAFGQESTRFCNYGGQEMQFVRPVWCSEGIIGQYPHGVPDDMAPNATSFLLACASAESQYKYLLDHGWLPEKARSVLPNSLKTEIVVTANFREWRHIFKLRAIGTTGRPHPQMQALMIPVMNEFKQRCPAVFGDLELKEADK